MNAYVLDTSVAAKWFLPGAGESLTAEASEVLRDFADGKIRLSVPDLFWPEFGNILRKAVRVKRMSLKSASASIAAMGQLAMHTTPSMPLLNDAFSIAATFDRTVYDCIYVALALASGRPFLTADERLANALAARFPIRWLGTYARA
jgi:predicted nucleic acid-binding protein